MIQQNYFKNAFVCWVNQHSKSYMYYCSIVILHTIIHVAFNTCSKYYMNNQSLLFTLEDVKISNIKKAISVPLKLAD